MNRIFVFFLVIWVLISCKNDDNLIPGEFVPPQTLSETEIENDENIVEFLKTHFYNYEEFATPPIDFDFKIKFDTIAGDNANKTSIFDSGQLANVEFITETISVAPSSVGRGEGESVNHRLYILVARQGLSEKNATIGDNMILRYEGSLLNDTETKSNKTLTKFDASSEQPVSFNLSQVVRGFGNGLEYFRTGTGPIDNGDGTVSYDGFGIGTIFMPSGLGYFDSSGPSGNITAYSPLFFNIDAFDYEMNTDLDGDGIPSILEDVDGDGNLNNDNTDVDTEPFNVTLPNHVDADDDNDGIPTIDEIELDEDGNFVGFKDTDGDGISDHLDNDN